MPIKETIRGLCPNYLPLRKLLARIKIRERDRYLIPNGEVSMGEAEFQAKEQIIDKYKEKWPRYISQTNDKIQELFNSAPSLQQRKDKENLRTDILFCRLAYGFQPNEYLSFGLENKNSVERRAFVSDTDRWRYVYKMNDTIDYIVLGDKWRTYKKFKDYFHREVIYVTKEHDYEEFCSFVNKHPLFVKKDILEARGKGIEFVDSSDISSMEEWFKSLITDGKYIIEELVVQDEKISVLNPSSVNTVRCATVFTRHGVEILFCFLRIGREGSFVDNGGAGGIEVGIDIETGRLNTFGFDHFGEKYDRHPDTGITLNGFELPQWKQMLDLCIEMSMKMPTVKYIAWDMAYTKEGWILIEGNNTGQMMGPQVTSQCGIKDKMEHIIKDVDLLA